jgi:hypothetical protein
MLTSCTLLYSSSLLLACYLPAGQSASLSWCQAPIWDLRPEFYYYQTVAGLLMWGALSDERTGLPFTSAAGLASTVVLGSESRRTRGHILLYQIRDSPKLEGQVPIFISPRNRVAQFEYLHRSPESRRRRRKGNPVPGGKLFRVRVKVRVTLRLAPYRQAVRLGTKPLETHGQNIFQQNTCVHSPYVTSYLTGGWVCRLQLLLALASAVNLRSEYHKTHDHILLSQIRDSPNLELRSPYLYPPGTAWPSYTPGTGFTLRRLLRLAGLRWRYSKTPPHPGGPVCYALTHKFEADRIQNIA